MAFYEPYKESHVSFLYNLLFCDDIDLFKNDETVKTESVWSTLMAEHTDAEALRTIAESEANEARVRALAFNRLRASGVSVPAKILLGVNYRSSARARSRRSGSICRRRCSLLKSVRKDSHL